MKSEKKYAVRLGFGFEGHGAPILVAEGNTTDEADERARERLQSQFDGLWVSKYSDTYIGSLAWLKKNFPLQKGWTKRDLEILLIGG